MLDAKAFGLAGGILWGVSMFVMTFIAMSWDYGRPFFDFMANVYIGYDVSVIGAFIGMVYGFLDAFIGCFIFAWLYNRISRSST